MFGNWMPSGMAGGAGLFGYIDAQQLRSEAGAHAMLLLLAAFIAAAALALAWKRNWKRIVRLAVIAGGATAWYAATDALPPQAAAEFMVEQAALNPGHLDLVAIGPLTNVAEAITLDRHFVENIRSIHIMGASFDDSGPEHNILSDTRAADIVIRSTAHLIFTPVNVTRRVRLAPPMVDNIDAAGPIGKALAAEIRQWMDLQAGEHSIPHDATTALGIIRPDMFQRQPAIVDLVTDTTANEGATTLRADNHARSEVVIDLDEVQVRQQIVDRVCAADTHPTYDRH